MNPTESEVDALIEKVRRSNKVWAERNWQSEYENIKNGCPWIQINEKGRAKCRALICGDDECHYENCAIIFWLRNTEVKP